MSETLHELVVDGGTVQYLVDEGAPADAKILIFHHGTPAAGPVDPDVVRQARAAGLRVVELVRPGYGRSTRQPGRTTADVVPLVAALADHLGADRFVSFGWSGGGPHVLATAALMPDRCVGAVCLAGVAPFEAEGLDYLAGMGQDNIDEFGATVEGPDALAAYLEQARAGLVDVTGDQVIDSMTSLLPPVDRELLTGDAAEHFAAELRWSVASGIWGWFDDNVAFVEPWGFDVASIDVPVQVWQGSEDLMVPFAHGQWLAANVGSCEPHLIEGEGHLSLVRRLGEGFVQLRGLL